MIRLASPDIPAEDIARVVEVLKSGDLIQGAAVETFEAAIADFTGVPCAVVSSGTAALHLALMALDIGPGDGVLIPAFTFPATANVVERVGATPVMCDVDPTTYVATCDLMNEALTTHRRENIRLVMPVQEFGFPTETLAIIDLASRHGARVLEDAACAFGTIADGKHPGNYSDAACLSFHPRKAITTGEGGAVLSRDSDFLSRIRRLRNHGIQRTDDGNDFVSAGLNYRMTNFQAAMAMTQLSLFTKQLHHRRALVERYVEQLGDVGQIRLPRAAPGHSWQSFMVVVDERTNRDAVRRLMRERGVETNIGAQALNCLSFFRNKYGFSDQSFPVATSLYQRGLVLPMHSRLSLEDVNVVSAALKEVLRELNGHP